MQSKTTLSIRPKTKNSDSRRRFLRYAGFTAVTATTILAACEHENAIMAPSPMGSGARVAADGSIDLGSGDLGLLNYAYVLEQLEYAFYARVVGSFYGGINNTERSILIDIHDHEKVHVEYFKAALDSNAIQPLKFDFDLDFNNDNIVDINFTDRTSVLTAALMFEDLGVSAYNGAGKLLSNGNNLSTAAKIVSVEARHAFIIRELLFPFASADVVTSDTGFDVVKMPADVLEAAQKYIVETITCGNLPTR